MGQSISQNAERPRLESDLLRELHRRRMDNWVRFAVLDVGICCMGIVEHAFARISAMIGKAVVERGWIAPQDLVHYTMHAELDIRHAEEFFAIVEPGWEDHRRRAMIEQGLGLGAYAFDQLYRGMCGRGDVARAACP